MSWSASLFSSTSSQPRSPRDGQAFGDCAGAETASEFMHNRAVLGFATKMRKVTGGLPFTAGSFVVTDEFLFLGVPR